MRSSCRPWSCADYVAQAYNVCNERDLVPEMVFLLGRMGDNRRALNLIIERLGDVNRVWAVFDNTQCVTR